jgi:hypothetical protein
VQGWIEEIERRIGSSDPKERQPLLKKRQSLLKKRLDILAAQLRSSNHPTLRYVTPADCRGQIVSSYDEMMTDVYKHLSYLQLLNYYTKQYTNNRWYYSRKRKSIHATLISRYTSTPHHLYTMRTAAWEWFFMNPSTRKPLHYYLFYYLIWLQDDKKDI